ncbi:MAG: hypothetical protein COA90_07630 [Gammaproteobacteria bacterium]|nr:MAG: hypothetical protein COA90_07630 [Gammaproteobacteria bacterium]
MITLYLQIDTVPQTKLNHSLLYFNSSCFKPEMDMILFILGFYIGGFIGMLTMSLIYININKDQDALDQNTLD